MEPKLTVRFGIFWIQWDILVAHVRNDFVEHTNIDVILSNIDVNRYKTNFQDDWNIGWCARVPLYSLNINVQLSIKMDIV